MHQRERTKRQRLEAVLSEHDARERRTLADLRSAGFHFQTIAAARRYRVQLATFDRFNQPETARRTA